MSGTGDQQGTRGGVAVVSHFWVSVYPFFETSLLISAAPGEAETLPTELHIYDPDGELINEVSVGALQSRPAVLELDPLLGACKLEGGLKHAHLVLTSPVGRSNLCRIHSRAGAAVMGEPTRFSLRHTAFFPVTFSENRSTLLAVVNCGLRDAMVRCRLYYGKRLPEIELKVPAMGCRVVSLAADFKEYAEVEPGRNVPAYLRVSTTSDTSCGAQLLEIASGAKEGDVFTSIS